MMSQWSPVAKMCRYRRWFGIGIGIALMGLGEVFERAASLDRALLALALIVGGVLLLLGLEKLCRGVPVIELLPETKIWLVLFGLLAILALIIAWVVSVY